MNILIDKLLHASAYEHPVDYVKLLETHISWVILTGQYVYKIKKPVDFGFIDYSSLEKRHYFCEQEILLNKPLADELYCQVMPIVKTNDGYHVGGEGEVVEYAVQMREFSQQQLLNYILPRYGLNKSIIDSISKQTAYFHLQAPVADNNTPFGSAQVVEQYAQQNFDQARELLSKFNKLDDYLTALQTLEKLSAEQFTKNSALINARKNSGFVRSCHGDLHLGNITLINGVPIIFDCIEFNDYLRWIDVMADIAFLMMDFYENHRKDYAVQFINTYLTYTGDYAGLALLPFYFAYRCMVRAKIQLFSIQENDPAEVRNKFYEKYAGYVKLATNYLTRPKPFIIIMHGFSGSGKSTVATHLAENFEAIILRSDVERKRLFDLHPEHNSRSTINGKLYQPEVTQKTYAQLKKLAGDIIESGYSVILDAACLEQWQRQVFIDLAKDLHIPFVIVNCEAPIDIMNFRVEKTDSTDRFFSEADAKILQFQQKIYQPLTDAELARAVTVNTSKEYSMEEIKKHLQEFVWM